MVRYKQPQRQPAQMETAMTDPNRITLYYSPQTRATGTRVLLEELRAPYALHVLNMKAGEQRLPAYLAINSLGKVPAIRHGEALVTEQVAITIYLADLGDFDAVNRIYGEYFSEPYPARVCVEVSRLPKDARVEIDAVALAAS